MVVWFIFYFLNKSFWVSKSRYCKRKCLLVVDEFFFARNPFLASASSIPNYSQSIIITMSQWRDVNREIHRSQESLQERTVELEYLLLLDEAEVSQVLDDKSSARVVRVSSVVMKKLSQLQSTESVDAIALMKFPTTYFVVDDHQDCSRKWFPSPHRILVLEGIQDPGNLGTLLRSALALGWVSTKCNLIYIFFICFWTLSSSSFLFFPID